MLFKHDFYRKRNIFRIFAPSTTSANIPYLHRIFSDFPAKSTLYTLYIYMVLANPIYIYIILATPTRDMSLPVVVGVYNMCAISAGHYNNADASHLNINPLACCGAWLKGKALVFINSVLVALPAFPPQSVTCSVRAPTAQH